jgi:nucleoside-diphosphate-sugar epimerase
VYTPRSSYVHDLKEGFMPPSVVTGAAGFIGSHLAEHRVALGHEVVGIDCFTPYYSPQIKRANLAALMARPRFQVVAGDLSAVDLGPVLEGADDMFLYPERLSSQTLAERLLLDPERHDYPSHDGVVDTHGVHRVAALVLTLAGARAYGRI